MGINDGNFSHTAELKDLKDEVVRMNYVMRGLKEFKKRMESTENGDLSRMAKLDIMWKYLENQKRMVRTGVVAIIVAGIGQLIGIIYLIAQLT